MCSTSALFHMPVPKVQQCNYDCVIQPWCSECSLSSSFCCHKCKRPSPHMLLINAIKYSSIHNLVTRKCIVMKMTFCNFTVLYTTKIKCTPTTLLTTFNTEKWLNWHSNSVISCCVMNKTLLSRRWQGVTDSLAMYDALLFEWAAPQKWNTQGTMFTETCLHVTVHTWPYCGDIYSINQ